MGVRQTREMVSDEMTSDRGEWREMEGDGML
jgi:hypothetical protein